MEIGNREKEEEERDNEGNTEGPEKREHGIAGNKKKE